MINRPAKHFYEFGPYRLDVTEQLLLRDGVLIPLTPKAFDTLLILAENSGHLVEKDELMTRLWPNTFVEEANLAHNISMLRKAFGENSDGTKYIQTVPRRGYRFVATVKESWEGGGLPAGQSQAPAEVDKTESDLELEAPDEVHRAQNAETTTRASVVPSPPRPWNVARSAALVASLAVVVIVSGMALFRMRGKPNLSPLRVVPFTSYKGNEQQPAFSPDGSQIAYVWDSDKGDNSDIYVKLIDGGAPLQLTRDEGFDTNPVWSPDGHQIAFLRRTTKGAQHASVYLISSLGGPERKLTDFICTPAAVFFQPGYAELDWSPDSKVLAVAEKVSSTDPSSIFLVSVETDEKLRLTMPSPGSLGDATPAFSPDGQTLAFIRMTENRVGDVFLIPVVGGDVHRLTFDNQNPTAVDWTADGSEIVFRSNRGGGRARLWRVPISGGEPAPVAGVGDNVSSFAISRRGNRLAYTEDFRDPNIWRVAVPTSAGRSNQPTMLIGSTQSDQFPQYSPDGKRIAFASDRSGNSEIWGSDSDGSNAMQLTFFNGPGTGTPRWSPDGNYLAFDSRPGGNADIFIIKSTGGQPRRLTSQPSRDIVPSWSTDGRWIYFTSNRSGTAQVWKVPAGGGDAVQVTYQGGFGPLPSPDGKSIYYAKGVGEGVLWRIPTEGGNEKPVAGFTKLTTWSGFAVTDRGIYSSGTPADPHPAIEFFDFTTSKHTTIAMLEKPRSSGFAVSPDGKWILYTQMDRSESDIMLAENFR